MDRSHVSTILAANSALIGSGDVEQVGEFFTPEYVAHLTERDMGGHEAIRRFVGMLRSAFPDLQCEVEVLLEGNDRVAWQRTLEGTHKGDFMGFPPSGRQIVWRDMLTSRFSDGLIAEEWVISDLAEHLLRAR